MKITKYEIDMLDVKAADAILIHFCDDETGKWYVVLIDAGTYINGTKVVEFVKNKYGTYYIDLAICTHCDDDHFGGFIYILEQMRDHPERSVDIKTLVINDPGLHITPDDVKSYQKLESVQQHARQVYTSEGVNLLELAYELQAQKRIELSEGMSDNHSFFLNYTIEILGPSKEFYKKKALLFDNDMTPYDYDEENDEDDAQTLPTSNRIYSKTLDQAGDDQSQSNQSSIILLFKPSDGKKFLFTGDAGVEAFSNFKYSSDLDQIRNIFWLKVPHHGSKKNLNNDLVNLLRPALSYVSTERYKHYLTKAVVSALKKAGSKVYSTHNNGNLWLHVNIFGRGGEYGDPIEL